MSEKPNPEFFQLMLSGIHAEFEADVKEADEWVQKSLETTKIKAERKAANPNAK